MTARAVGSNSSPLAEELRQQKLMFDNTWTLVVVLATAEAVLCWYFRLAQVDIGPIIWTLAALALLQLAINAAMRSADSRARVQWFAFLSQMLGTVVMGFSWHMFGGLQQPVYPLLIVLPLLPGALLLSFWQRQMSTLALVAVLLSGVLLSADTNSFIEERYGLVIASAHLLPSWIPRSRQAFADVSTSPSFDLVLMATVAAVGVAVSTTARALVGLSRRGTERFAALEGEVLRLQQLNQQLVAHAPTPEVVVMSHSGRIVHASDRFMRAFDLTEAANGFLLDAIAFTYPNVVKRLMATGGETRQAASVRGRDVVLRVRAEVFGSDDSRQSTLSIEDCTEICWRAEVDALADPVFALNAQGRIVFPNRAAVALLGADAEGLAAASLFDGAADNWWNIAPLECARRIVQRGERQYVAAIQRGCVAPSMGELSFVHLHQRGLAPAAVQA